MPDNQLPNLPDRPTMREIETSRAKSMGVASLVLGIIALLSCLTGIAALFGIIAGIIGLVLGSNARNTLPPDERGIATAGWICSIVALCLCVAVILAVCGFLTVLGIIAAS